MCKKKKGIKLNKVVVPLKSISNLFKEQSNCLAWKRCFILCLALEFGFYLNLLCTKRICHSATVSHEPMEQGSRVPVRKNHEISKRASGELNLLKNDFKDTRKMITPHSVVCKK